jgi:hypothetical protein
MGRWASYKGLDSPINEDGDGGFIGLNMKDPPDQLEPGMLQRSENKRLRRGVAETRPGTFEPGVFNSLQFDPPFVASGIYSNPNKDEVLLIAEEAKNYIWACQPGVQPKPISLFSTQITRPPGGDPGSFITRDVAETVPVGNFYCRFCQAFDKIIFLRAVEIPMQWDGIDPRGFGEFVNPTPSDPTVKLVPRVWNGEAFQGHILYSIGIRDDRMIMSEAGEYSIYDPIFGLFRINAGKADRIVRVLGFSKEAAIIFQGNSIHTLTNFTIDPLLARQEMIQENIGLVGPEALVQVGSEVFFLSRSTGIYALSQVEERRITAAPVPISDRIQPIIDRINWTRASLSCAAPLGDYAYFAVPLDNDLYPRTLLVLNTVTKQWESIDHYKDHDVAINALHLMNYGGARRLFAINYQRGRVYLVGEGTTDMTTEVEWPIHDLIQTRGYGGGGATDKDFRRMAMAIRTRDPHITITAISDGVNEQKVITPAPITKDNLSLYTFDKQTHDPFTDDPQEPYREDYAQDGLGWAGQDWELFEELPMTNEEILPDVPGTAVPFLVDVHQPKQFSNEKRSVRKFGRYMSFLVENSQGACDVLAVETEGREVRRATKVAA